LREIKIIVPLEKAQIVETVLNEGGIEFSKIQDTNSEIILIGAPPDKVELILGMLSKIGLGTSFGRIHVSSLDIVFPTKDMVEGARDRISTQELLIDVIHPSRITTNFIIFAILSSILAALGLIVGNAVIIIASMLISPFLGPIIGITLGSILFDRKLVKNGIIALLFGLGVGVLAGILFTITDPNFSINPEIALRSTPTIAELGLAIISGLALSISTTSKEAAALVGVAIAAALVPPIANIGIGIGSFNFEIAFGSTILLLINIIAIIIVSMVTFWVQGIRPKESVRREKMAVKKIRSRFGALAVALIVASIPLLISTISIYQRSSIEGAANNITNQIFLQDYPNAILISVQSSYYPIDPFIDNQSIRIIIIASVENEAYLSTVSQEIADAVYLETLITTIVSLQIAKTSISS
jgi:uncharacterized hydrophobic protein (TIGR00341 family)